MKVVLAHNLNREEHEHEAEFDLPLTIEALVKALEKEHEVTAVECTQDFVHWLTRLVLEKPDIIFNIAEGYSGAARESVYPAIYEQLGIPYSGPGPTELLVCHNKALTKTLLERCGIPMAWDRVLKSPCDLQQLDDADIPFPLIVKLNSEGSSLGMDEHCIVNNWDELSKQVATVWNKFHTNILIEQFIEGIDLSTSFIEGMGIFGPVQYTHGDAKIYDFRLKTRDNHAIDVVDPKDIPDDIRGRLKDLTQQIASVLDVNGYGRADFRLSPDGSIYFLEMNAQVCFHPIGAFILAAQNEGHSFDEVVLHIVRYAKKHGRRTSVPGR